MTGIFSDPNEGAHQTRRQSERFTRRGLELGGQQQAAQQPDFNTLFGLLRTLAAQPLTMSDDTTNMIISRGNAAAQEGAAGATRKLGAAAGAKGDARSGSTNMMQRRIDTDLGAKMSDNVRQALIQQAMSRPQDLMNAAGAFLPALGQQNQIPLALLQLLGGGSSNMAGISSSQYGHPQQNMFGQGLGTLLSLLAL